MIEKPDQVDQSVLPIQPWLSYGNQLRYGFAAFVVLSMLITARILIALSFRTQQVQLVQSVDVQSQAIVAIIETQQTYFHNELALLAETPSLMQLPPAAQAEALADFAERYKYLDYLRLIGTDGRVVATFSLGGRIPETGLFISEQALELTSSITVDPKAEHLYATAVFPITNQEGPQGFLQAWASLTFLESAISWEKEAVSSYAYIVANSHYFMITRPDNSPMVGVLPAHLEPQLQSEEGFFLDPFGAWRLPVYQGLRGVDVFRSIAPIEGTGSSVIVEFPTEAAMTPARQMLLIMGIVLMVVVTGALALGLYYAHRIVTPLHQLTQAAVHMSSGQLDQPVVLTARHELGLLAASFNHMAAQIAELIKDLEMKVMERTQALESRSLQLQAAAVVARDATNSGDMDELLRRSVDLVRERFGFYHVGIYLVDEDGRYVKLQAATGETGQQMLAKNHKLVVGGPSMVGYVSQNGEPRIALDVEADPIHWRNPLLPQTRSEIALPLKVGPEIIGVLDVQSLREAAFDEEDVTILQTLADLLAVTIMRMRLFEQTQATLEKRLQTILAHAPLGLFSCDKTGALTFIEGKGVSSLDEWPDHLLGGPVVDLFPDDPVFAHDVQRALAGEAFTAFIENDDLVWEIRYTPLHDLNGFLTGVIGVVSDVTEGKRIEKALYEGQKLESLGIMAGGVAHDFNNLLVAIMGHTSLALTQLPAQSPAHSAVKKAVGAAERAADLTRQLLAYSGRGHFEVLPLDFNELVRDNLHLLQVAVPKWVHLNADMAASLPLILADAGQMQQVIMNLILNAAEAIEDSPGTVTVATAVQDVDDQLSTAWQYTSPGLAPGAYVTLTVADTGKGMDATTLAKIFDPFYTTKKTGHGLGLAAVLGIVRGHKGGVCVYSEPENGTIFKLLFPVSQQEAAHACSAAPSANPDPSLGAVLVVDDEGFIREAVTDILELEGLNVITAANGHQAVSLYQNQADDIALVLLDLSMPGMSGEDTFHALRQINPEVRVILSSGYNKTDIGGRFTGNEFVGFIQKPYRAEKLVAEIKRHVRQAQAKTIP